MSMDQSESQVAWIVSVLILTTDVSKLQVPKECPSTAPVAALVTHFGESSWAAAMTSQQCVQREQPQDVVRSQSSSPCSVFRPGVGVGAVASLSLLLNHTRRAMTTMRIARSSQVNSGSARDLRSRRPFEHFIQFLGDNLCRFFRRSQLWFCLTSCFLNNCFALVLLFDFHFHFISMAFSWILEWPLLMSRLKPSGWHHCSSHIIGVVLILH